MRKTSTKIKIFSFTALGLFTLASVASTYFAMHVPTNYAMDQFVPQKHALMNWDRESKKVFHISDG